MGKVRRREWERSSAEKVRRRMESLEGPPIPAGIPALEHGSAMEALMARDPGYRSPQAEFGSIPKPNFLAEELEAGRRADAAARAEAEAASRARREGKDG